jgi:hypothetical protein
MTVLAAIVLYAAAPALIGVKLWSSVRGMDMRDAGTLWTTREGWRIYALTKIAMPLFGFCLLGASALLHAPGIVLVLLGGFAALITALALTAVAMHLPKINAARRTPSP